MSKKNIELIRQALGAAESSIKLAKQLLNEIESGKVEGGNQTVDLAKSQPGVVGTFDGENMVTTSGETFPVPVNYASKSLLVVGDTLKMVEEGKEKRFKQIEHVKRYRTSGIITKKDGKWKAITPEGSYKVLPATVEHLGADVGSEVLLHLPANNLNVAYAAIESIKGGSKVQETKVEKPTATVAPVPAVKPAEKPQSEVKTVAKPNEKPLTPKPEPQKKEEVATKSPSEHKSVAEETKLETPKITVAPAEKPEAAKPKPVEPKPVVQPVVVATNETKPAIAAPSSAPVAKPMVVSPEEEELT